MGRCLNLPNPPRVPQQSAPATHCCWCWCCWCCQCCLWCWCWYVDGVSVVGVVDELMGWDGMGSPLDTTHSPGTGLRQGLSLPEERSRTVDAQHQAGASAAVVPRAHSSRRRVAAAAPTCAGERQAWTARGLWWWWWSTRLHTSHTPTPFNPSVLKPFSPKTQQP